MNSLFRSALLLRRSGRFALGLLGPSLVATPFYIGMQPVNSMLPRQYAPGSEVTLSVNSLPAPTGQLQWLHDTAPVAGADQSTLQLTNLSAADSGNYRLRVTNGSTVEYSDTATLNVLPLPSSPVDTSFTAPLFNPPNIQAVGPFADDGSMIVGHLSSSGEYSATRLNASGAIVSSFALPSSAGIVLAGFPDGGLLTSRAPFRVTANGTPIAFTLPAEFDSAKPLTAAMVLPGDKFLLAQNKRLARFNADGSLDATFTFSADDNPLTSIESLQSDLNGRVYVGGRVTNPVPTNFPTSWPAIFRVAANGQRDTGFATQNPSPILNGSLLIAPLSTGRILYYSAYHGYRQWRLLLDNGLPDPAWAGETTFTERVPVVNQATDNVYITTTSGELERYHVTTTSLVKDAGFYDGFTSYISSHLSIDPNGDLLVYGDFNGWDGHATSRIARLHPNAIAGPQPPNATALAPNTTPPKNSTVTLSTHLTGTGPFSFQWLALDGQPLPANTTAEELVIPSFSTVHFGRYQLRLTGSGGVSVLSNVVEFSFSSDQPYLSNLSGRALTGSGEDTVIAGLSSKVYAGALGLPTLLRGVGPALKPLGVTNFLPNPAIDVFNAAGALIANNDQWTANPEIEDAARTAGAFSFGGASNDAALLHTFSTGNATLMLRNQGEADGVGLIEIYQLFPMGHEYSYQSLLNLSFRARTGPGDGVAIAGFVIVDPQGFGRTARVLLRAIGPTLRTQGIVHPLENPVLTLFNSKGERIAQNDDWSVAASGTDATATAAVMKQVGAFELAANSKDSSLLLDLPAGAYSMHANGGSGVVLLEIYLVR